MKTAIYGGSFNPPHLGHVKAAATVWEKLEPDRFLIIPTNIPPHKDIAEGSPSPEQRMELCRLAFRDIPGVELSAKISSVNVNDTSPFTPVWSCRTWR